jgi:integrase/recombinase XerC
MRILTTKDLDQFLSVISPRSAFGARDSAMFRLALHIGVRVSELCGLRVKHLAHDGEPRRRLELPRELGKGGRTRIIPLNSQARDAISELLAFNEIRGFSTRPDDPLLYTRDHQPLTPRAVRAIMQKYRELAGLDVKASPHTLRHTAASRIVKATGNAHLAMEVLGHQRLNTVTRYLHSEPDELDAAMELAGNL